MVSIIHSNFNVTAKRYEVSARRFNGESYKLKSKQRLRELNGKQTKKKLSYLIPAASKKTGR